MVLKRAGRRLLVSPWFAVGAGVVIATGAMIYTPHTNLAIDIQQCKLATCTKLSPQGAQPLQAGPGSQVTAAPHKPGVLAGMTFSYLVLDRSQDEFSMQITIRARHSIGQWKLAFVIPGAKGVYVYGARWKQIGPSGGIASNYFVGTESAGYAMISAHEDGSAGGPGRDSYTVQFQVRGTGVPSQPTQCSYNGTACHFTLAHDPTAANLPAAP
ncbi:MAG TPA: hypothetical protein VEV45_12410 [Streptosporangiaceae bacterium]|nr:hypothetical protein [Streptosporangiaceae bacterium]